MDPLTSEILGEDPEDNQVLVDATLHHLAPQGLFEFTAALMVAERLIGQLRVNRLIAPLLDGCQLSYEENLQHGTDREEVDLGQRLHIALDVIEGVRQADVHWLQLIVDIHQRAPRIRNVVRPKFHDDNGPERGAITESEWQIEFKSFLNETFDDLADARDFADGRSAFYGRGAEREKRMVRYIEAQRALEQLDHTSRLQERVARGFRHALANYDSIIALTVDGGTSGDTDDGTPSPNSAERNKPNLTI